MPTETLPPIRESNLSRAWGTAFLRVLDHDSFALSPTLLTVDCEAGQLPPEDPAIRKALDTTLRHLEKKGCSETAATIFPFNAWRWKGEPGCADFSKWYLEEYLPRHRARVACHNGKITETYFSRMIAFRGVTSKDGKLFLKTINQLELIVDIWRRDTAKGHRPRQSALQAACFNPSEDSTGAALSGFPCLQQVSFAYDDEGGLALSAYYPTQYVLDRAYGNYLGLCQLGFFMARQLGLRLARLNCFIGKPELGGGVTKGKISQLEQVVRARLAETPRATVLA